MQRAASETGPGGLVYLFLHSPATVIPDTDMLHSLYQTHYTPLSLLPCFLEYCRQSYLLPSTVFLRFFI